MLFIPPRFYGVTPQVYKELIYIVISLLHLAFLTTKDVHAYLYAFP